MKKTISVILILVCCLSAFAIQQKAFLSIAPYALETYSKNGSDTVASSYGFGVKASYEAKPLSNAVVAGLDLEFMDYSIPENDAFIDLNAIAKVGYGINVGEKLEIIPEAMVGLDVELFAGNSAVVLSFGGALDVQYAISDKLYASVTIQTLASSLSTTDKYLVIRPAAFAGVGYSF